MVAQRCRPGAGHRELQRYDQEPRPRLHRLSKLAAIVHRRLRSVPLSKSASLSGGRGIGGIGMNQTVTGTNILPQLRHTFAVPRARSFVTVVISTLALILACLLFAPSSVTWGALSGSLPFAAIIAIVGLGQLLVVQQGGFDLSLAVVISTHYPQGDNALLLPAILIAVACAILAGLINGILVSFFRLNAIVATIGVNALLYGGVFAVSGGVPKTTTTLLAEIAGGRAFWLPNTVYFALATLVVVSFILKK